MVEARRAWRADLAGVDPARLVFVDESGADTAMDRTHGRAPCGVRVDGPVPHGHGKTTTLTAAIHRALRRMGITREKGRTGPPSKIIPS